MDANIIDLGLLIKKWLTILVVIEPLGIVPIYMSMMAGVPRRAQSQIIKMVGIAVFVTLAIVAVIGQSALAFFGVSLPSMQIGGGIVLMWMAIGMLGAETSSLRINQQEENETSDKVIQETNSKTDQHYYSVAVVPIAIPLLAGPGAIGATILQAQGLPWIPRAVFIAGLALISIILVAILYMAEPISKRLGHTGMNVSSRLIGLLLAAISIEIIYAGLIGFFPKLL